MFSNNQIETLTAYSTSSASNCITPFSSLTDVTD